LPKYLETDAQVLFQFVLGGFGTETVPILFDGEFLAAANRSAPPVWRVGAGANMAFRRSIFDSLGFFDERLGAGAAGCSEDSEMWYRVLANGGKCLYEPRALVVHHHRETMPELRSQVRAYMRGHTAALVAQCDRYGHRGNVRRMFVDIPKFFAFSVLLEPIKGRRDRLLVVRSEILGWAACVFYLGRRDWRRNKDLPVVEAASSRSPQVADSKATLSDFLAHNPFPGRFTDGLFYREKMRAIHKLAPERGVGRILEVGGGRSGLTALLYPHSNVISLDIAPPERWELPVAARQHLVAGNALLLPFADNAFDMITLFDVVEHVVDDRSVAAEALRVVRPGGAILLSTPNENWRFPYYRVMKRLCPDERDVMQDWGHVRRGYSHNQLVALMGSEPERTEPFINPLTALCHDISFSRLGRRTRLFLHLVASPLTIVGYGFADWFTKGTETVARWRI
jgi:SAM-dependent methyltransferase